MAPRKAILIALDMLRADHLSCYGYPRETTPNIDTFAEESTLFEDCTSSFCCTVPSFTGMLTGKSPLNHGMILNAWDVPNIRREWLDDETPTIAEVCWDAGLVTGAVDNLINFGNHPSWFARGQQFYMNASESSGRVAYLARADAINGMVLPWLDQHGQEDFLLFVHYWDPHGPWTQPEEWNEMFRAGDLPTEKAKSGETYVPGVGPLANIGPEEREKIDLYDGSTRFVDDRVKQVLDKLRELGIYDEAAIMITSDHGRNSMDQPPYWQARGVRWGACDVPLILKAPGVPAGKRCRTLVHGNDLAPTLLDLLGLDGGADMDGESLLPVLNGERESRGTVATCGNFGGVPQWSIRDADYKLVRSYKDVVLDLEKRYGFTTHGSFDMWTDGPHAQLYATDDKYESIDLAAELPGVVVQMEAKLTEWKRSVADDPEAADPLMDASRWGIERDSSLIN